MTSNRLVNASQAPAASTSRSTAPAAARPPVMAATSAASTIPPPRRKGEFVLPIIEDASSLQLALNKIMQALVDKLIDQKTASILLYGLQIAGNNLKQFSNEQFQDDLRRRAQLRHEMEQSSGSSQAQPARIPSASAQENAAQPGADANAITDRKSAIANDNTPRFNIEASAAVDREEEQERLQPPTHLPLRPRLVM